MSFLDNLLKNANGNIIYNVYVAFAILKPIFIVCIIIIFAKLLLNLSKANKRIENKLDSILNNLNDDEIKKI